MNNCVVGYGMVGKATAALFGIEKHFDIDETRSNMTTDEIANCDIVFICLPTPVVRGDYDVQPIRDLIKNVELFGKKPIYVIRSTVYPGFADSLMMDRVVSNPEFLTESSWERDIKFPPYVILGGQINENLERVRAYYDARIKSAPIIITNNVTAEMAKLALNGFFATKVIYANSIYDLCKENGANYDTVKTILEKHPFGYKNHAEIFHKGGRGAGGKCLRKDLEALSNLDLSTSSMFAFLKTVYLNNERLLNTYPKKDNEN